MKWSSLWKKSKAEESSSYVALPAFVDSIFIRSAAQMEVTMLLRVGNQPGQPLRMRVDRKSMHLFPLHQWVEFKLGT
jgi:hypothetical protein